MIPAGIEPVDAAGVARIRGVSLGALRNAKVLKSADFPAPLNPHRGRDLVWNPAEVEAHRAGLPIAPRAESSPDDLLDEFEAAAVVGVSAETFTSQIERLGIAVRHISAHDLRYFRRGDLTPRHSMPPGQPGKPVGAKDLAPRRKRGAPSPIAQVAGQRAAELIDHLAELQRAGGPRPSTQALAEEYGVSPRTIQRWLARVDKTG